MSDEHKLSFNVIKTQKLTLSVKTLLSYPLEQQDTSSTRTLFSSFFDNNVLFDNTNNLI